MAATSAATAAHAVAPWQVDLFRAVALLIGNEGAGLPLEMERSADVRVRIPLALAHGVEGEGVESLNAASAAAILLYEAVRQRSKSAARPGARRPETGSSVGLP